LGPIPLKTVRATVYRLLWSIAVIAVADVAVAVLAQINLLGSPDIPWFVVGAAIIWILVIRHCRSGYKRVATHPPTRPMHVVCICIGIGIVLSLIALGFMDRSSILAGAVPMIGDRYSAPTTFKDAASLALLAGAGVIEEMSIRGIVQLGLESRLSPASAEAIADLEFVLLHFPLLPIRGELPFVILLALVNGRLTARTNRPRMRPYWFTQSVI
jgi:membrane protease YdiL (CAAX protease family)